MDVATRIVKALYHIIVGCALAGGLIYYTKTMVDGYWEYKMLSGKGRSNESKTETAHGE